MAGETVKHTSDTATECTEKPDDEKMSICSHQILTTKVNLRTVRVNIFPLAVDP